MSACKPLTAEHAVEWGYIPDPSYIGEYNWLASKLEIDHKSEFVGNVFYLRQQFKKELEKCNG